MIYKLDYGKVMNLPPLNQDAYLKDLLQVQTFPVPLTIQEQMALFYLVEGMLEQILSGEVDKDIVGLLPVFNVVHAKFVQSFNGAGFKLPAADSFH